MKKLRVILLTILIQSLILSLCLPSSVLALTSGQKKLFDKQIYYYDPSSCAGVQEGAASEQESKDGTVFMVGDSITLGARDHYGLKEKFKTKGLEAYIIASGGSSIARPGSNGSKLSGLDTIDTEKERVKQASKIVVALGTNDDVRGFKNNVDDMIKKIRSYNETAIIYWVNVKTNKPGNPAYTESGAKDKNEVISGFKGKQNFEVIDIFSSDVPLSSDKIHPDYSEAGFGKWGEVVADGVNNKTDVVDSDASDSCECSAGSETPTSLSGTNDEEKIFNFFVSKGLKPFQAAGIMGNMYSESGLNPRSLEPGTTGDFPIAGRGYGLVQWTFPVRQDPLIKKAKRANKKVYDLGIQLEYVMDELGGSHKSAGDNLKKTTNVEEATLVIELQYEVHAGGVQPERQTQAKGYLTKYGSGSPGGGAESSTSDGSGCSSPGENGSSAESFSGSAQQAARSVLDGKKVTILDDRDLIQQIANGQSTPISDGLIKLIAGLAQSHSFSISSLYRGPCSGSNHCTGNAVDINPSIDGQMISYGGHNPKIQAFISDAAKIMGSSCENGVPNQQYVDKTKAGGSKCEVFIDKGTGPHVHLAVKS